MKAIPVEYADATPGVKAIYDDVLSTMQRTDLPNWIKYLGNNEKILNGNWQKFRCTIVDGEIPMLLKQIIMFIVSRHYGSEYCIAAHAHAALEIDKTLKYEDLVDLSQGQGYEKLPAAYKVAIEVGVKCALHPQDVTSDDLDLLREEDYSEEEILELISQADVGIMFNIITMNAGIPMDAEYRRHLPEDFMPGADE